MLNRPLNSTKNFHNHYRKNQRFYQTSRQPKGLPSSQNKKLSIDFSWVSFFSFGITIFTAVAFAAGKAYRQHYLAKFNISDTLIPWSFQDVVYLGITKQLMILLSAPLVAIAFVLSISVFSVFAIWLSNKRNIRRNIRAENLKKVAIQEQMFYLI